MSLENFKQSITALIMLVLIVAAFAMALNAFRDDMSASTACVNESSYYNSTMGQCCRAAGWCSGTNNTNWGETTALNTTTEGLQGVGNASSYLSTIGTLIGVAALIFIVVGAFMFARR